MKKVLHSDFIRKLDYSSSDVKKAAVETVTLLTDAGLQSLMFDVTKKDNVRRSEFKTKKA